MIPYGRQLIDESDIDAVVEVLKSDFLTQGPVVKKFEEALSGYTGAKHCVCVNSATSALHAACFALKVNECSNVWTSCNTFVASANCARIFGANVDLIDIAPETGNISTDALRRKLESTPEELLPDVLIVVHFAGQPCDMELIYDLSQKYGFKIIEDASHALGSSYRGIKTGSCTYSDITVFSFHPVKMITSAEGGAALTNNTNYEDLIRKFSSHGIDRSTTTELEPWFYESEFCGLNYRMSDLHAAMGLSQLSKLDNWVVDRRNIVEEYKKRLSGLPLQFLFECEFSFSSYHILVVRFSQKGLRNQAYTYMRSKNIGVQIHYVPIYRHSEYRTAGLAGMENYYETCLTLPLYPALVDAEIEEVCSLIKDVFNTNFMVIND